MVFFWMAFIYFCWPMVLALMGLPLAVIQTTSRAIWATWSSFPDWTRVMRYRTFCSSMISPLEAKAMRPSMVRAALSAASSSPEIFRSEPRFRIWTPSSCSMRWIFSSREPKTLMRSSTRSTFTIRSVICIFTFKQFCRTLPGDHLLASASHVHPKEAGRFPKCRLLPQNFSGDHIAQY